VKRHFKEKRGNFFTGRQKPMGRKKEEKGKLWAIKGLRVQSGEGQLYKNQPKRLGSTCGKGELAVLEQKGRHTKTQKADSSLGVRRTRKRNLKVQSSGKKGSVRL